jgi:hypothetical protein
MEHAAITIRPRRWEMQAVYLALSVAVLTAAAMFSREGETRINFPFVDAPLPVLCHLKRLTGLDCPGCGMTRCFVSLAHGDMASAWRFNPAGILLFALVVVQIPYRAIQIWRVSRGQSELNLRPVSTIFIALLVSALLLQWAWKLTWMVLAWNGSISAM